MDVVRLMGGLGNQMFQYALGRRLAVELGREVRFDIESGFRRDIYGRRLALDAFRTELLRADPEYVPIGVNWRTPWHRVAKAAWLALPHRYRQVIYERIPFWCDQTVLSRAHGPAYYFGYWQNEAYFLPIQGLLRQEFTSRLPLRDPVRALMEEMARCRAVSVHVRCYNDIGADGKIIQEAQDQHGVCPVEYYQRAVEHIGRGPGTLCYVFSDNLDWARANLKLPAPCQYVADVCPCSDVEEMMLMAACQHHVISNSTFSWWGAWLGGNPEKIVVAPRIWKRGLPENAVDVCPREWTRM